MILVSRNKGKCGYSRGFHRGGGVNYSKSKLWKWV